MKDKLIAMLVIGAFLATNLQASWVIVNDDGSTAPLPACCGKKPVKKVRKKVKSPKVCLTCDYSKFPLAKLEPVGDEKLPPATLKNCGK